MVLRETWSYIRNFVKDPKVGSITPCSRHTVKRLCQKLPLDSIETLVEFGPGSGVFTRYLLDHMPANAKLIAIEVNESFVRKLRPLAEQDARLQVYHDQVENLGAVLEDEQVEQVDGVVSGIPFSMIPLEAKKQILAETYRLLKPGGQFLAYQTSYALVPKLKAYFDTVKKDLEPRNLPPMYLMEAKKGKH
jgi:phosphatidylethanolamine/phosphatidyl-N-methylethanolamine N-methyltransferase